MIILRTLVKLLLTASLISCSADDDRSMIEIYQPDSIRQILQIDSSNLKVNISVNGQAAQTFYLDDGLATNTLSVTGILPGQQNAVTIVWIEVLDGSEIRLSRQQQVFTANGNTLIDAQHFFGLYDYDNDGISNFEERQGGFCVWPDEVCDGEDLPDIGVAQLSNSENLLANGDFTDEIDTSWFSSGLNTEVVAGEYCLTSPAEAIRIENAYILQMPLVSLESGREYHYSIRIKATAASNIEVTAFTVVDDTFGATVFDERYVVSTNYRTINMPYSAAASRSNVRVGVKLGSNSGVRFCVDSISLSLVD